MTDEATTTTETKDGEGEAPVELELTGMAAVEAALAKLQDVVDNPAHYRMTGDGDGEAPTNLWHDVLRDELAKIKKNLPAEPS